MSKIRDSMRNKTAAVHVRPRSFRRRHLMVSLAAFALTIAAVYILSRYIFPNTSTVKGSKAGAAIEVTPAANIDNLPENSVLRAPLVFTEIQSRIKAPEFLRQIL